MKNCLPGRKRHYYGIRRDRCIWCGKLNPEAEWAARQEARIREALFRSRKEEAAE